MIQLAGFAVFSGLSLNLLLQFALGAEGAAADHFHKKETGRVIPLTQLGNLFIAVLVLWFFFGAILPAYWKGFSEYFLFFPLSALVCMGLELLEEKVFPLVFPEIYSKTGGPKKIFRALSAYDGLVPAALMITCFVAENFPDALVLSFFFAFGNFSSMLILSEIRRRSTLEWVPRYFRGTPLILVSMGLLSLIAVAAAGMCFRILEIF